MTTIIGAMRARSPNLFMLGLAGPTLMFGALLPQLAFTALIGAGEATHMTATTTGTLIEASSHTAVSTGRPPQIFVSVRYAYEAGKRRYESTTYGFDRSSTLSAATPAEFKAAMIPGAAVTVYYDPASPERACLAPTAQRDTLWQGLLLLIGGALCVACAIALGHRAFTSARATPPPRG